MAYEHPAASSPPRWDSPTAEPGFMSNWDLVSAGLESPSEISLSVQQQQCIQQQQQQQRLQYQQWQDQQQQYGGNLPQQRQPDFPPYGPAHAGWSPSPYAPPGYAPAQFSSGYPGMHPPGATFFFAPPPEHDMTASVTLTPRKRKRKPAAKQAPRKRPAQSPIHTSETVGAGPPPPNPFLSMPPSSSARSLASATPVPSSSGANIPSSSSSSSRPCFGSLKADRTDKEGPSSPATDVWYFMYFVDSLDPPDERPTTQPTRTHIKSSHVACRLCIDKWRCWKNTGGNVGAMRDHLSGKAHGTVWGEAVIVQKLKGWEKLLAPVDGAAADPIPDLGGTRNGPFDVKIFYELLLRWIVVDDQAMNVMESPELRALLLYLGTDLTDAQLPHRTKLTNMIVRRYVEEHEKLLEDVKNSVGRVSWTADVWTDPNQRPFLACTAHYMAREGKHLVLRARLVMFRYCPETHSGDNMGDFIFDLMQECGTLHKVGQFTLDNASNNHTMMVRLETLLGKAGIPFHRDGNRIRCFPHVINIAVKRGLKLLTKISDSKDEEKEDADIRDIQNEIDAVLRSLESEPEYLEALLTDPVARCRDLVVAVRASGKRRKGFIEAIERVNFCGDYTHRVVQLLRDVDTRWSSTFLMVDRVLELYDSIEDFLNQPEQRDITTKRLTESQLDVLNDIRQYLFVFHSVQQSLSSERTPTLSLAIPAYESLLEMLRDLKTTLPRIAHAIQASIHKIEDYVALSRQSRVHALAMTLNPGFKYEWMEQHWTGKEVAEGRRWMRELMIEFRTHDRHAAPKPVSTAIPSPASSTAVRASTSIRRVNTSMSSLNTLKRSLSKQATAMRLGLPSSTPTTSPAPPISPEDAPAIEQRAVLQDGLDVDDELRRYEAQGLLTEEETEDRNFDLVMWWQGHAQQFPYLYRVALDILPVQASAVPCERMFSSSKQTTTTIRNKLSPKMVEALQLLKYNFRSDRLDFTADWIDTPEGLLSAPVISPELMDALITRGDIEELEQLLSPV